MAIKHTKTKVGGPRVPAWVTEHYKSYVTAQSTLVNLIHISEKGISVLRAMPKIVKVIAKVEGSTGDPKSTKQIEVAEQEAALAQTEVDKDFPVLHSLAVVALWSGLEHFIKGLIALWLTYRKDAVTAPAVQRLKVKVGDFLQLSQTDRAHYLVGLLEQDLASSLRRGVSRFESLLEPFSLDGSLPDGCAKTIFELQQVRNVVAHCNGIADRRLRSECPWLKTKLNQPVSVTRKMLFDYFEAVMEYTLIVFYRVGDKYGHNLRPDGAPSLSPRLAVNTGSVTVARPPTEKTTAVSKGYKDS